MAQVAQHMYKRNVQSKVKAAEQFGIHPKTFNRMIARQSDKWAAMLVTDEDRKDRQVMKAKNMYRQAILKAGDSPLTAEQQEQATRWCDEHPCQRTLVSLSGMVETPRLIGDKNRRIGVR